MMTPKRVYVDKVEFREMKLATVAACETIIDGSSSYYIPSQRLKVVHKGACKPWPTVDGDTQLMTPTEAARTELKREFPDLKRLGWRGKHKSLFSIPMPFFCRGPVWFLGYHIDLTAAYWQIYRNLMLDCRWPRGLGMLELRGVADRLEKWKLARNALVGITRSTSATAIKNKGRVKVYPDNPFLTPLLWANIQYVLHSLASISRDLGGHYCMTDGYLMEEGDARRFMSLLDVYDIKYTAHYGEIEIKGWQSYRVEGYRTTHHYRNNSQVRGAISNIVNLSNEEYDWLNFVFKYGRKYYETKS